MKLQIGISAVVLLLVALLTWWFFSTYERVPIEVPVGYRGEARVNPFFAAEKLLQSLDYDAESRASLTPSDWLPPPEDTLVVRVSPRIGDPIARSLLRQWVTEGGHLVLLPPLEQTLATDSVIETFGFRLEAIAPDDDAGPAVAALERPAETETTLDGYVIAGPLSRWRLESLDDAAPDLATLGGDDGTFVARRSYENGYVTVIADGQIFTNARLAKGDHARLFLDTVAGRLEPGAVWLVYEEVFPSLPALIWRHARYFVLGIALSTVLWLWSMLPRFGPLVSSATPARRSILEHIAAAARFSWRFSGPRDLVESAAFAVVRRAELRRPGIARMPLEERAAQIGRLARERAETVAAALRPVEHMGQREFTQRISELKRIRNEL
jgi:hypothetical protein